MSGKEIFIEKIEQLISDVPDFFGSDAEAADKALKFFNDLKKEKPSNSKSSLPTENGMKILRFMRDNRSKYNNVFKAKDIGEGLFISGRSVSGSMKKLVTDGYASKEGKDPVIYGITDAGLSFFLD